MVLLALRGLIYTAVCFVSAFLKNNISKLLTFPEPLSSERPLGVKSESLLPLFSNLGCIVLRSSWPILGRGGRQVPGRGRLSRPHVTGAMPRMPRCCGSTPPTGERAGVMCRGGVLPDGTSTACAGTEASLPVPCGNLGCRASLCVHTGSRQCGSQR